MIKEFFTALPCEDAKTIFLLYATSGLRRNEALTLQMNDLDFEKRMIIPSNTNSSAKRTWVTFYNVECEQYVQQYMRKRDVSNPTLFQFSHRLVNQWFSTTKETTGINISPQRLREWFCSEMGRLGVQDRYVDAFLWENSQISARKTLY
jgi:site-specific recombinase XerD